MDIGPIGRRFRFAEVENGMGAFFQKYVDWEEEDERVDAGPQGVITGVNDVDATGNDAVRERWKVQVVGTATRFWSRFIAWGGIST